MIDLGIEGIALIAETTGLVGMTKIFEDSPKKKTTDCVYLVSDSQTMKRLKYILYSLYF